MTKLVRWIGRNGKPRSAIIHPETASDPQALRAWAAWNGYDLETNPAKL